MVDCCGMRCVERRASVLWTQKALDSREFWERKYTNLCARKLRAHILRFVFLGALQ